MKESKDQNTITMTDGTVFVAIGITILVCEGCAFLSNSNRCTEPFASCAKAIRKDGRDVIFIKEPK